MTLKKKIVSLQHIILLFTLHTILYIYMTCELLYKIIDEHWLCVIFEQQQKIDVTK